MSTEYQLPPLPFGAPTATLARWLKQPGDQLAPGEPLLIVVNDRVEVVLPVPLAGVLETLLVPEGAPVAVGAVLARIVAPARAVRPFRISPVARRIAAELEIDITEINGSGPGGRVVKADLLAPTDDRRPTTGDPPQSPTLEPDEGTDETHTPLSSMRRAIAEHMLRSRSTSPHALTAIEVDMGQVSAVRARLRSDFARRGYELTYTACIAQAAVAALLAHPLLNSSWSERGIVLRRRVHLGIAVALPGGLITPVIREAQDLSLRGLARALGDVARRARAGSLRPGEASGGTFTITNPGAGPLWFGTPIIPQPQAAILGVGAVQKRPLVVADGGVDRVVVRPVAVLTLSYDARVLDQCHADAFLRDVKRGLERFGS